MINTINFKKTSISSNLLNLLFVSTLCFSLSACGSGGEEGSTGSTGPSPGDSGVVSNVRTEPSPSLFVQDTRRIASEQELRTLLNSQSGMVAPNSGVANSLSTAFQTNSDGVVFDPMLEIAGQVFTQVFTNGPRTVSSLNVNIPKPENCPGGGSVTVSNFQGTDTPNSFQYFDCVSGGLKTNGFFVVELDASSTEDRSIITTKTNLESGNTEGIIRTVALATETTENYEYPKAGFWTFYSIPSSRPEAFVSNQVINPMDRSIKESYSLRNILYSEFLTPNQIDNIGSYETYGHEFSADLDGNVTFPDGPSPRFQAKLSTIEPVIVALQSNSQGTRYFGGKFRIKFSDSLYIDISPQEDNTFLVQLESDGIPGYERSVSTR